MRTSILLTTLLSASAWAQYGDEQPEAKPSQTGQPDAGQPKKVDRATCELRIQEMGLEPGLSDQLVTVVQVADQNSTLKYFPDNVVAPVGSVVQFHFNPKNHTVTESSFAEPCKPLSANLTNATRPGQRSGFVPVTLEDKDVKVYNVLINDTKPIWIYCGQGSHCQQGMVMVINQNPNDKEKTLENFKKKAAEAPLRPGVPPPPAPSTVLPVEPGIGGIAAPSSTTESSQRSSTSPAADQVSTASTTSRPSPGSGAVASGPASGTPAALPGSASFRTAPVHYAGLVALFVAGAATLL